jgi:PhzF family phenazine biosynthesis protein
MLKIPYYRLHSFTSDQFTGNPAGVCILDHWLSDQLMQKIAFENNLSETAFIVGEGDKFNIRWFTPAVEVDLCGHATLAAGYIIFEHTHYLKNEIEFNSRSGILKVERKSDLFSLNFPIDKIQKVDLPEIIESAFKDKPDEVYRGSTDFLLIYSNEMIIRNCSPDFSILKSAEGRGIIVSSIGDHVDFVSRFFAPQSGINEDPVTGSSHTTLVPYWSKATGKNEFVAHQLSSRGGELICRNLGDRVQISGKVQLYMTGDIHI